MRLRLFLSFQRRIVRGRTGNKGYNATEASVLCNVNLLMNSNRTVTRVGAENRKDMFAVVMAYSSITFCDVKSSLQLNHIYAYANQERGRALPHFLSHDISTLVSISILLSHQPAGGSSYIDICVFFVFWVIVDISVFLISTQVDSDHDNDICNNCSKKSNSF